MSNNNYQQMADAFGAEFEEDVDVTENVPTRSLQEIKDSIPTNEVAVQEGRVAIEDETYIKNQFRVGVEMIGDVAEVLREDLNQGAKASQFEAFSGLMRERRENLVALQNLNTKTYEMNNDTEEGVPIPGNVTTNNMVFTSTDVMDMIIQARDGIDPDEEAQVLNPDDEVK